MTLPLGTVIEDHDANQYSVEDLLGRGGFGAVYLVRKKGEQGRLFAMKEIVNPERQERRQFLFEGDILKRLRHKALPRVYQVFEDEQLKRVYMLMDYIEGRDLDSLLTEQPEQRFPHAQTINLMQPVVEGIMYLHNQKPPIVHRDIKPDNIIVPVDGTEAILVDFGTAKEYVEDQTTSIIRHGSPGYAALEQYGSGTNIRTDIYALGATLYTLLTGETPIDAITRASNYKTRDPLPSVQDLIPDIPTGVALALEKAMAVTKDERFASVEEFWQAFRDTTSSTHLLSLAKPLVEDPVQPPTAKALEDPVVHIVPLEEKPLPWSEKRRRVITLASSLFLLFVIGCGILLYQAVKTTSGSVSGQKVITATPFSKVQAQSTGGVPKLPSPSLYPLLAQTYVGTIADIAVSKNQTDMYLMNIQQKQERIQGIFQGLGQAGTFTGTVSKSGEIEFTVPIYNGTSTIVFNGNIKIGGGMAGSYNVLNQNQQNTGQFGQWAVNATGGS